MSIPDYTADDKKALQATFDDAKGTLAGQVLQRADDAKDGPGAVMFQTYDGRRDLAARCNELNEIISAIIADPSHSKLQQRLHAAGIGHKMKASSGWSDSWREALMGAFTDCNIPEEALPSWVKVDHLEHEMKSGVTEADAMMAMMGSPDFHGDPDSMPCHA